MRICEVYRIVFLIIFVNCIFYISDSNGSSVIMGLGDCKQLVDYGEKSNVKYRPGLDVRGRKVKSADYNNDFRLKFRGEVVFDINIDIARKYNLIEKHIASNIIVGKVKLNNGQIFINDLLLERKDQSELMARCQEILIDR